MTDPASTPGVLPTITEMDNALISDFTGTLDWARARIAVLRELYWRWNMPGHAHSLIIDCEEQCTAAAAAAVGTPYRLPKLTNDLATVVALPVRYEGREAA